ncbi:hypothetical protein MRX96_049510 [Rhipicephalus microplus]
MYQACLSFASSNRPETTDLVRWMNVMNLDFLNTTRLERVNPVDVMVRGSLDLGVEAIISIRLLDTLFVHGKRVIEMHYSKEQETWLKQRSYKLTKTNENDYCELFIMYGVRRGQESLYAKKILAYEEQLSTLRYDGIQHWPQQMNIPNAQRCRRDGCSSKSRVRCRKCDIFLCLTSQNDCFYLFHTK